MSNPLSLLGDDDPDDYPTDTFRVNKDFSGKYDVWRQKEEMAKLKALKNNMSDSSSESESEEEPVIEKDFLKALSLLKSDDPKIYSEAIELFKDDGEVKKKPKAKKEKPMFMKDFERELVLKRNGEFSEDEEEGDHGRTLAEEEELERKVFMDDSSEDDDDEDTLREKSKMKAEEDAKEADYLQFLKGQKKVVDDDVKEMSYLQKYWNDPKLDKDEKFLRDYILDEKFVVKDKSEVYLTNDDEEFADVATLSDDEEMVQKQEQFEHKYNFRFEEPDTEFIKRYPRTIGDSLRREDSKRKQKREEYTERKKKEKDQKREELKRLKALKRKEIEEKFLKLKEISGQEALNFDEDDMDSDFDPDKHDRKMKELFNDDYYAVEEQQKPEFEYDEELDDEKWDHWTRDQVDVNKTSQSDEEEDESEEEKTKKSAKEEFEQEMIDSSRVGRKRGKKKSLFAKIISQPKPIYDPDGKSFDDYLDEYYKMDFEDVVGDLPVRFKYRKVVPNDFGLSVDEILAANDKELNRWCSVKKTCQYRREDEENYDVQAFQKKAQNVEGKKKILSSVYAPPKEDAQNANSESKDETNNVKRKKRRSKKKKNANSGNGIKVEESANIEGENEDEVQNEISTTKDDTQPQESNVDANGKSKKRKKKKKNANLESSGLMSQNSSLNAADNGNSEINRAKDLSSNFANNDASTAEMSKKSKKKRKRTSSEGFKVSEDSKAANMAPDVYQLNPSLLKDELKDKAKRKFNDEEEGINVKKRKFNEQEGDFQSNPQTKSNEAVTQGSNQSTGEASKTNKKSRKRKNKKDNSFSNEQFNPKSNAKNFSSAKPQNPDAEKKLAIPNSRLASYGLNPKKFKNSIIYSK